MVMISNGLLPTVGDSYDHLLALTGANLVIVSMGCFVFTVIHSLMSSSGLLCVAVMNYVIYTQNQWNCNLARVK